MRRRRHARVPYPGRSGRLTSIKEDQVVHWILRTLVRAGAARAALGKTGLVSPNVLAAVGVSPPEGLGTSDRAAREVYRRIRARLQEVEARDVDCCMASRNAELLGGVLGLSRTETAVLGFVTALDAEETLRECFAELRCRALPQIVRHMATVLQRRRADVERALHRDGALRSLPLVALARGDHYRMAPLTLPDGVEDVLLRPLADEEDLIRHFLDATRPPELALAEYPHVRADVELLARYLRAALARRQQGVNILVHGPPGTGKTELVRALAVEVGANLHEVSLEDDDNDALDGRQRLQRYALCQRILRGRRRALLLFDEVEDAFPRLGSFSDHPSPSHKAWTNRLLEGNGTPTFWISNAIYQIDRAFIRRFDYVLELPQPPRSVRRAVITRHLEGLPVGDATIELLADQEALSPAHVHQASKVLRLLHHRVPERAEADLVRVVDANLRAFAGVPARPRSRDDLPYDPELLNIDADPAQLARGLARTRRGTVCFHGPPGTGKTALGRHLADTLDLPLQTRRASDLLSKWLGDTEKLIAQMFERAAMEGAVLLLDEADSFLTDRRRAERSWEVTQVNEMLTQMEQFDGVFICTTNLMEHLDRAALRRFAIKVKFDYLKAAQAGQLFQRTAAALGATDTEHVPSELARLRTLAPGDFAAVARRMRTLDVVPTPDELGAALAEECALKRDGRARAIGFSG